MESRRERKKQQTRGALLDAAMALFAERGIYGTASRTSPSASILAREPSTTTSRRSTSSSRVLVARGVETFEESYLESLEGSEDVADRVAQIARLHVTFFERHPQYALLFHQARGLLHLKNTRVESLRAVFADYLLRVGRALVPDSSRDLVRRAPHGRGGGPGRRRVPAIARIASRRRCRARARPRRFSRRVFRLCSRTLGIRPRSEAPDPGTARSRHGAQGRAAILRESKGVCPCSVSSRAGSIRSA